MANTYTKLYIHLIFAVKGRKSLIKETIRERVEQYIGGIIKKENCRLYTIYCNPDHIHILLGIPPTLSIAFLVRTIKINSTKFINEQSLTSFHFCWQKGYGAFTCSHSGVDAVANYILQQPFHHKVHSFKEEYVRLLKKHQIEYDEKYLFE